MNNYKLGSLFDGSGGFPLAGALCGIEPVWAAEIEPYPIAVTRSRFPNMKHLGDISKVNGAEIEPVDIITFGSPCQDLSVAGKRAGLKHADNGDEETTRSGLFMEAVRIIKEMRRSTNGQYPRFAIWENVPGAFSSNGGGDFRVVCEELIKIVEPSASMPAVPTGGWSYADSYVGDGWSLAYRVFDAQYWGVPQRRRRIYLVADLRGERAREILFEREGLRGYFAEGTTPWQAAPADAQGSPGADDREGEDNGGDRGRRLDGVIPYTLKIRSGCEGGGKGALVQEDKSATLATNNDQYLFQPTAYVFENHSQDTRYKGPLEVGQTVSATYGMGGNNQPFVVEPQEPVYCLQGNGIDRADTAGCNGKGWKEDTRYTLNTIDRPAVVYAVDQGGGKSGANVSEDIAPTLCTTHGGGPAVAHAESGVNGSRVSNTLVASMGNAPTGTTQDSLIIRTNYIVRRLTPTECARLQGFADWWGVVETKDTLTEEEFRFWHEVRKTYVVLQADAVIEAARRVIEEERAKEHPNWGAIEKEQNIIARAEARKAQDYTEKQMLTWYNKLWTDSAEYKMWGNGIALPTALYCVQGVADALNAEEFDGWLE